MFWVAEVTTLVTVISVSLFEKSFFFFKYSQNCVLFIVCVVTLSSHNTKFNFNKEKNISRHSIIIRLDVRKFLCMVYTTIARIRKSTWVVSYWPNFKLSECYWVNSKWNKRWVHFSITMCEKKVASVKFGYSVHKALQKIKNKTKQNFATFLCTFFGFDTSSI